MIYLKVALALWIPIAFCFGLLIGAALRRGSFGGSQGCGPYDQEDDAQWPDHI